MSDDEYKVGKDQIYVGGPLYDYAAKGNKVELVPGDAGTYKIKLTTKDNTETTYVFDCQDIPHQVHRAQGPDAGPGRGHHHQPTPITARRIRAI